jgi:histone H3/H4
VRPGDEWIGYPPGRPRKRRREDDENSGAEAEAEGQAQGQAQARVRARARVQAQPQVRVSAHNIQYPPMTNVFVRQVVQHAAQTSALGQQRLAADALETFSRASEWFFRQLGDDVRAYAQHAGRSMVEERDLIALMHR